MQTVYGYAENQYQNVFVCGKREMAGFYRYLADWLFERTSSGTFETDRASLQLMTEIELRTAIIYSYTHTANECEFIHCRYLIVVNV